MLPPNDEGTVRIGAEHLQTGQTPVQPGGGRNLQRWLGDSNVEPSGEKPDVLAFSRTVTATRHAG